MVSVVMITYNHEDYIEEAIGGVLKQECDFDIELIISNDTSTDRTAEVVQNIIAKDVLPENLSIRFFDHKIDKGMIPNFVWSLKQAQGKYIALCEGDDYWTDNLKLQKQVDFLEENINYVGLGSNSSILFQETLETKDFDKSNTDRILTVDDFLSSRLLHTATFIFKNNIQFPNDFNKVLSGDRLLFLLVATQGNIYYKNEITCVYRKNVGVYPKELHLH